MRLENAIKCAATLGTGQVYQQSKGFHIRGIKTGFDKWDHRQSDWVPVEPPEDAVHIGQEGEA